MNHEVMVWTELGPADAQFNSGVVYAIGPNGQNYIGGTQGGGLLRGSDTAGPNGWSKLLGGDVGAVAVDPANTDVIYASTPNDMNAPRIAIRKSTDGGATFHLTRFGMTEAGPILNYLSPLVIDANDPKRLWTCGQHIWRTDNRAANWTQANAEEFKGAFTALAVAPSKTDYAIAGTEQGFLLRTDQALTASDSTRWLSVQPRRGVVSALAFDPSNENTAYAAYSSSGGARLWKSLDSGASWTGIDGTGPAAIPNTLVNTVAVDPTNSDRIFAGTDDGLFVSTNGGAAWAGEPALPPVPVKALVFNTARGVTSLYAFTRGRGAWRTITANTACGYALSAASQSFAGEGGIGSVNVRTEPEQLSCAWTARSNAAWIAVTSGASGNGNGTAGFSVSANNTAQPRTGTVTIAGRTLVVTQTPVVDTTPPVITMTSPTPSGEYRTDLETITLAGMASDNIGVEKVTLSSDRGDIGVAYGTANWMISPTIRLGITRFTVTARDLAGNTASARLTVISRPTFLKTAVAGKQTPPFSGEGGAALDAMIVTPRRLAFDPSGNLYFSSEMVIRRITPQGVINTVIGSGAGFGGDGGPAKDAQLYFPEGIAIDQAGNLFIADKWNHRIRKVTPEGIITTIAGSGPNSTPTGAFGGDGGPAIEARLNQPQGIALDQAGNLYVADLGNQRVRKISHDGMITTVAGNGGATNSGDGGPATAASVLFPNDVAVDAAGNLYIASGADRVRKVGADGRISTVAGVGNGDAGDGGPATSALMRLPVAVLPDDAGNLYISDSNNGRVRRVGPDGIIRTVATAGAPVGLARDRTGAIYVAESPGLGRISKLTIFPPEDSIPPVIEVNSPATTTGLYTTLRDFLPLEGTASDNLLLSHVAISNDRGRASYASLTSAGNWQVAIPLKLGVNHLTCTAWDLDGNSSSVRLTVNYVKPQVTNAVAGLRGSAGSNGDGGPARAAAFNTPVGLAFDSAGNLYVADAGNHRIRRITPAGVITTVSGSGEVGMRGDGGPATSADLNQPRGVAVDAASNLYFTDSLNHRVCKVTPAGMITTVAGNGFEGFSGDLGPATQAQLNLPTYLAVDGAGNLYFTDSGNSRVRKVDAQSGRISTVVSNADGIKSPAGLALDQAGALYVADQSVGSRVYKVMSSGPVSVFAGNGTSQLSSDGVPATQFALVQPGPLAFDAAGNLFIFEEFTMSILKVTTGGLIFKVANLNGQAFDDEESGPPQFSGRGGGLAPGGAGKLYFSDSGNHRLGVILSNIIPPVAAVSAASFTGPALSPNSIASAFGANLATATEAAASLPLPTMLAGTAAVILDSGGLQQAVGLFFASPTQINFLMPGAPISPGPATLAVTNSRGEVSLGALQVVTVAPALFSANATGQGIAAAVVLRITADGLQSYEPVAVFDQSQNRFVARPIDLGPASDQVILVMFGTGIQTLGGATNVGVKIGGVNVEVLFSGAQGEFAGLDQINARLPRSLAGLGEVEIIVTVGGKVANTVKVQIK